MDQNIHHQFPDLLVQKKNLSEIIFISKNPHFFLASYSSNCKTLRFRSLIAKVRILFYQSRQLGKEEFVLHAIFGLLLSYYLKNQSNSSHLLSCSTLFLGKWKSLSTCLSRFCAVFEFCQKNVNFWSYYLPRTDSFHLWGFSWYCDL